MTEYDDGLDPDRVDPVRYRGRHAQPEQPAAPEPTYEPPASEPPAYEPPAYEPPVYQEPVYQEPVHEEPVYQEPVYQEPVHAQPTHPDDPAPAPVATAPRGRRKERSGAGCLPALVVVLVVALVAAFGVWKGIGLVKDKFAGPGDFSGKGHGSVMFEVHDGDTATEIGRNLKAAGIVKSVDAFTEAASAEPASRNIQVGNYELKLEMSADAALAVLINPDNLVKSLVTVPEGLRVVDVVDLLVDKTEIPKKDFEKVLDNPGQLGLPDYAEGNPEGYLFPATYDIGTKPTAKSILVAMVDRWRQAADDADLEGASAELGYTPAELMTIASLVQAEARGDDMPKVARVIYNRIENPGTAGTIGRLQIDATVNYALNRKLGVALTTEETQVDSPYNTYVIEGLPPGPIEAPGDAAMEAATNPADGDWYYYVTVDLATGETKFAETYDEFLQYKAEFKQYCETSDAC